MFTCSGTEADETAVVLAQVFTGAQEIIALRHGYSGRSILAQSLTAHAPWLFPPLALVTVAIAQGAQHRKCGPLCSDGNVGRNRWH